MYMLNSHSLNAFNCRPYESFKAYVGGLNTGDLDARRYELWKFDET